MDSSNSSYQSFRYDQRPNQCVAEYAIRTGRRPELVIAHRAEVAALRQALPEVVAVDTLPFGGPQPGEIWLR